MTSFNYEIFLFLFFFIYLFIYFFYRRLASVFEKRLRRDQRKVENVTEFNTPTEVQAAYKAFFEGERIDAWNAIEKALSPMEEMDISVRFLAFIIFVVSAPCVFWQEFG